MARAFVFPGQGSQFIGMGKDLADNFAVAKDVFAEVDDALGKKLSDIIWNGPEEDLKLTENTQPALMAVSMAVMRILENEKGLKLEDKVQFVAGHSLGEYSALAAAGSINLSDTAKLLQIRGQAMQAAVPVGEGGMAALLGVDFELAEKIAEVGAEEGTCQAANDNAPGQVVVSGARKAIDKVLAVAREHGAKRAVDLPVSAPFHSALMAPAAEVMAEALGKIEIQSPVVPLVANVTAAPVTSPDEIRSRLVEQVTGTVRWRESVLFLAEQGVTQCVEIGANKVLRGLIRQIDRNVEGLNIGTVEDIEANSENLA